MTKTPFKFLDSYTKEDREIFFGREKEVEELHYKIFESNLLIVYGSSGTGKTSLIQCGLASKFDDADWMPILVRRGSNINESIKKTLDSLAITPLRKKNNLSQNIQSIYLDYFKPIYVIFDQFEELFIFGTDAEIEQFTHDLKTTLDANLSCRFIFVIRGEYLENISRFEDAIPDFFNNRMRIERMTRKNAARVITEPSALFNIKVSEDFPSAVIERLSSNKGWVELTYLQVYLDKLYKSALAKNPANPEFNDALLKQTGHIDDVLANFLDEQIAKTAKPEDGLAILKAFVSNEGTKKQMNAADVREFLLNVGVNIPVEDIEKYIRQFIDLRILKDKDENEKYEFRHDALAKKIFDQITFSEKEIIEVRQFILNRFNDFKSRGTYMQDTDVDYIKPYEKKLFLNDEQKEYVEKSIKLSRQKKVRQRNIITGITSAIILILICFSVYALQQRNDAVKESHIAEQKTRDAEQQKAAAQKAEGQAMAATKKALSEEDFAKLQQKIADDKSKMAEEQKQLAQKEADNAKHQTEIATKQKAIADQQKQTAETEKTKADQERIKAEQAEAQASRLHMSAVSQAVAFQALQVKNNPQLGGLLSCASYSFAKDNGGNTQDAQIFNALHQSLKQLQKGYPTEMRIQSEAKALGTADDGSIVLLGADGTNTHFNTQFNSDGKAAGTYRIYAGAYNTGYLSPNCKYAITAYDNYSVRIWDVEAHKGSEPLTGHAGLVRAAAFSNDGSVFVTGGRDSAVIVWVNNKVSKRFALSARIKSLAMSKDNATILAGCEDGTVYSCNIASGEQTTFASVAPNRVECLTVSAGGKYVIVAASNGAISIYSSGGALIKSLSQSSATQFMATGATDDLLVTGASNKSVHVYNLNDLSQKPIEISELKARILGIALGENGLVFVACANNMVRVYNTNTGKLQSAVYDLLQRNLTTDEWTTYIGKDIPYKKVNPNLP